MSKPQTPLPPQQQPQLRLLLIALIGGLALVGVTATSATDGSQRKLPSKVTFQKSASEETPQARAQRLQRECKGRPNAGMCAGHTR